MSSRQSSLVHLLYEKKFIDQSRCKNPLERVIQFQKKIHIKKSHTPQNYASKSLTCVVISSRSNNDNQEERECYNKVGESIPIIKYLQRAQNSQSKSKNRTQDKRETNKKELVTIDKKKLYNSPNSVRNSHNIFPNTMERLKININKSMIPHNPNYKYSSDQRLIRSGVINFFEQKTKNNLHLTRSKKNKIDNWSHNEEVSANTIRSTKTAEIILRQRTIARVRQQKKLKKSTQTKKTLEDLLILQPWNVDQEF